jgi:hypothetical protein
MSGEFELKVGQTFNSKNELINVVKQWHFSYSVKYQV